MAGFAKIFGDGDAQVLVKRGQNNNGDELVTFYARVDGVGVRDYTTTFQRNQTAASDAEMFFAAITEDMANDRADLIRQNWADDTAGNDSTTETTR